MNISELSKKSGLPASKLRYYEEVGLIKSIGRQGLKRTFDSIVLERLSLIALGRAGGFSLEEIQDLFEDSDGMSINRSKLIAKADELDNLVEKLRVVSKDLRHTAKCPAPSHLECPNFRRVMKAAQMGMIEPLDTRGSTGTKK